LLYCWEKIKIAILRRDPLETTPWLIPAEAPHLVVLGVARGEEFRAISFIQGVLLLGLPRVPSLVHADDPEILFTEQLRAAGVELLSSMVPLSGVLDRIASIAGAELLRRQGAPLG
jgi:hypothetical protein